MFYFIVFGGLEINDRLGTYRISESKLLCVQSLTLTVLNFCKFTSYCSLKPLWSHWSGMGEVVPARTSPTLHPHPPPTVHPIVVTSTLRVNIHVYRIFLAHSVSKIVFNAISAVYPIHCKGQTRFFEVKLVTNRACLQTRPPL